MSFPRFDGDVATDGTVQRRLCPVKNKIQFSNILLLYQKIVLYYLFTLTVMPWQLVENCDLLWENGHLMIILVKDTK